MQEQIIMRCTKQKKWDDDRNRPIWTPAKKFLENQLALKGTI